MRYDLAGNSGRGRKPHGLAVGPRRCCARSVARTKPATNRVEACGAIMPDRDKALPPMPTFSENLDQTIRRALAIAEERRHQQATERHLLLALTDDPDAAALMRACEEKKREQT